MDNSDNTYLLGNLLYLVFKKEMERIAPEKLGYQRQWQNLATAR